MLLKGLNLVLLLGSVLFIMFAYLALTYLFSRMKIARRNAKAVSENEQNL